MCKQKLPDAGGRTRDRAINTTDVMGDTVASYAISDETGGKEKRFWTTGNEPQ